MIIAFSGKRGVGKTVSANILAKDYGFKVVSFAEELKKKAKTFFPFSDRSLYGDLKEVPYGGYSWTPREFLIKLGSFMRYWDEFYWIKTALKADPVDYDIVIDDMRYKNEAKFLKTQGAKMVRIERYKSHNPYKGDIDDPSETDLDDYQEFDYRINEVENLSMISLHTRLDHIMEDLNEKRV